MFSLGLTACSWHSPDPLVSARPYGLLLAFARSASFRSALRPAPGIRQIRQFPLGLTACSWHSPDPPVSARPYGLLLAFATSASFRSALRPAPGIRHIGQFPLGLTACSWHSPDPRQVRVTAARPSPLFCAVFPLGLALGASSCPAKSSVPRGRTLRGLSHYPREISKGGAVLASPPCAVGG